MSAPVHSLPLLAVRDFGSGQDQVSEPFQQDRIFAIVHKSDPVLLYLPTLQTTLQDDHLYVFVHGGCEVTRFENMQVGTHEIPEAVIVKLLTNHSGSRLRGMAIRMCTCYGNILRPGDAHTLVRRLAVQLPQCTFEGYHGLVHVDPNASPPRLLLGDTLGWDPISGPYYLGPPGTWEAV